MLYYRYINVILLFENQASLDDNNDHLQMKWKILSWKFHSFLVSMLPMLWKVCNQLLCIASKNIACPRTYLNVVQQWCHKAGQEMFIIFLSPMVEFWISWFTIDWTFPGFRMLCLALFYWRTGWKEMAPSHGPINQGHASCGRIDQQWSTQNKHQIVEALIKNFQLQGWN